MRGLVGREDGGAGACGRGAEGKLWKGAALLCGGNGGGRIRDGVVVVVVMVGSWFRGGVPRDGFARGLPGVLDW